MPEDPEARRQQDLRDLEFYRQRVRPTVSDLWRTLEKPRDNNRFVISDRRSADRDTCRLSRQPPTSIADLHRDARLGTDESVAANSLEPATQPSSADSIWLLIAALFVLALVAWTGNIDRVPSVFPF